MKQHNPDSIIRAKEMWQIAVKCKWAILFVGVALSTLSIVVISLLPDKYEATTTVLVDPQKIPEKYVSATITGDPLRLNALTQEVLSTARLEQVIDRLQLFAEYRKTHSRDEILECMRKNIKIEAKQGLDRSLSVFTITYTNGNPQQVPRVANELADSFIEWSLAVREHQATETTDFLNAQLRDAKATIDDQESKLNSFKMQHLGELPEQLQANSQALSRLQVSLQANVDALNRLDQERTLLARTPDLNGQGSKPTIISDRMLLEDEQQKLKEHLANLHMRYSDEYPEVQQTGYRLRAVQKQLEGMTPAVSSVSQVTSPGGMRMEMAEGKMRRLQEEQRHLLAEINRYQGRVDVAPIREQELADLSREYQESKSRYQGLLDKTYSADMAKDLEHKQAAGFFTILDPARPPEKPVKPLRMPLFAVMIPFCFALSVGLAIGYEEMKGAVSTERELRQLLPKGTNILGSIPVIEGPEIVRRERHLAMLAVTGSLTCCIGIAIFLWKCHPYV